MIDQPTAIRKGEELDASNLEAYLLHELPNFKSPLVIQQFPSGFSNLTYLLRLGSVELVLRRPPFGNQVKSAHDMGREYRVLSKLSNVFDPAPKPFLFCEDLSIIGAEFYVMERRHGIILRGGRWPTEVKSDPQLTRALCKTFINVLSELHLLDYAGAGLADLGKPDGYVDRQVDGWIGRYEKAKTDDWTEIEELAKWLSDHRPQTHAPSLVHNDFKYDNLILDPDDLSKVVAVLDWEMSTVGDPLMDLGTVLAYWIEAKDAPELQKIAFGPTMIEGSLSRQELVDQYVQTTGFEMQSPVFYYCFGLFKLAVIVQQIYARYVRGHTKDPRFSSLNKTVGLLGQAGMQAITTGRIS